MFIIMMFMALAFGKPDNAIVIAEERSNFQKVQVYIDISEVHAPDGSIGTSNALNILISDRLQKPHLLQNKLQYWSNPELWLGSIDIYDWNNVKHMPTFSQCDYSDAVSCGIQNGHWTLRTVVLVGNKYSAITMRLYDHKGKVIGRGSHTVWGHIRWNPRWKLTKIKEKGPFGSATKEIFEMWPPEIEEIPPLIRPFHIGQVSYGVYSVLKQACTTKYCYSK
jgi:hypothetical protein